MVKLDLTEAALVLEAIEAKGKEYKDYPAEIQEFFMGPYVKLHQDIVMAIKEEQEALAKKKK